jgi:predicted nucleic acid-binding protein
MTYLLDVNVLLAVIWDEHPHHQPAFGWPVECAWPVESVLYSSRLTPLGPNF